MRNILFIMIAVSGCGPEPVCVTETLGLKVYGELKKSTCEDYELMASAFYRTFEGQTRLDSRFQDLDRSVGGTSINLIYEQWGCKDGICLSGEAFCLNHSVTVVEEKAILSPLIHELVHIAQGCIAWPLEPGDPYPGTNRVEFGHEGWNNHQVFEYIEYARWLLLE
jgi:hypothetical protein